jgi:hypothetical protein
MGFALMCATSSCTADPQATDDNSHGIAAAEAQLPNENSNEWHVIGPPRLSPSEFERFLKKARNGDVRAMHTLSVHYLSLSKRDKAYDWLREAAKLGDCEAVDHLVDDTFEGVSPREARHWLKEQKRLGCDPNDDYGNRPTLRYHPERGELRNSN